MRNWGWLLIPFLTACSGSLSSSDTSSKVTTSFSIDGVKQIRDGLEDGSDSSTYKQSSYGVGSHARILVRFESLKGNKDSVLLGDDDEVWIRFTIVDLAKKPEAISNFSLCPLTRGDWMMWASWTNAHPFAKSGRWSLPGSDYDANECTSADSAIKNDPDTGRPADPNAVYFKVTRWFRDFVVGRNVNFGHVLKSSGDEISVYGDASGSYSPRILWNKTVK